jgi:hypothetical protein
MKYISHRGNLSGPNSDKENHPDYIKKALKLDYDVEIDVWYTDEKWYLGHDSPTYQVKYDFLTDRRFWLHAKNGDAFNLLVQDYTVNVFWHTTEDWVLTSKRFIWTYPGKQLYPESVCVLPEHSWVGDLTKCHAVCTDFVKEFPEQFEEEYWIN